MDPSSPPRPTEPRPLPHIDGLASAGFEFKRGDSSQTLSGTTGAALAAEVLKLLKPGSADDVKSTGAKPLSSMFTAPAPRTPERHAQTKSVGKAPPAAAASSSSSFPPSGLHARERPVPGAELAPPASGASPNYTLSGTTGAPLRDELRKLLAPAKTTPLEGAGAVAESATKAKSHLSALFAGLGIAAEQQSEQDRSSGAMFVAATAKEPAAGTREKMSSWLYH